MDVDEKQFCPKCGRGPLPMDFQHCPGCGAGLVAVNRPVGPAVRSTPALAPKPGDSFESRIFSPIAIVGLVWTVLCIWTCSDMVYTHDSTGRIVVDKTHGENQSVFNFVVMTGFWIVGLGAI